MKRSKQNVERAVGTVHICNFSTGLSDLNSNAKRDPIVVYDAIMRQGGLFSAFDVDHVLAPAISKLFDEGYIRSDNKEGFPYIRCLATEKGRVWREGRLVICSQCAGDGYTKARINRRSAIIEPCPACDGKGYHIANAPEREASA